MNSKKGFTLIELLLVISIIALLSAIILGNVQKSRSIARDRAVVAMAKEIQKAVELYKSDNGRYPHEIATGTWTYQRYVVKGSKYVSNTGGGVFNNTSGELPGKLAPYYKYPIPQTLPSQDIVMTYSGSASDSSYYYNCSNTSNEWKPYVVKFYLENPTTQFPKAQYYRNGARSTSSYTYETYYYCLTI